MQSEPALREDRTAWQCTGGVFAEEVSPTAPVDESVNRDDPLLSSSHAERERCDRSLSPLSVGPVPNPTGKISWIFCVFII